MARGKKVDRFWIQTGNGHVEVDVRLERDGSNNTYFVADDPTSGVYERHSDINVLRKAFERRIRDYYTCDWEAWYLVEVEAGANGLHFMDGEIGTTLTIHYGGIVTATDPEGNPIYLEVDPDTIIDGKWSGNRRRCGHGTNKGAPEIGTTAEGNMRALIPATAANLAALTDFCDRLDQISESIKQRFAPAAIGDTLKRMKGTAAERAGVLALQAP